MTQLASICKALLDGEVLSIMTGFKDFGCTNLPREIGRSVERKFGVVVDKTPTPFRSKRNPSHGGVYYRYRLPRIKLNKEGIKEMKQYVKENS